MPHRGELEPGPAQSRRNEHLDLALIAICDGSGAALLLRTVDDVVRGRRVARIDDDAMWAANPIVGWLLGCRLEGFAAVAFATPPDDADNMGILGRLMESGPAALANLQILVA